MDKVKSTVKDFKNQYFIGKTQYEYYGHSIDSIPYAIYVTGTLWYKIRFIVNFENYVDQSKIDIIFKNSQWVKEMETLQIKERSDNKWAEIESWIKCYKENMSKGQYYYFFPYTGSPEFKTLLRRGLVVEKLPSDCLKNFDKMLKVGDLVVTDFYLHDEKSYHGYIYMGNQQFYNEDCKVEKIEALPIKSYRIKWQLIKRQPEIILKSIELIKLSPIWQAFGTHCTFNVKGRVTKFEYFSDFIKNEKPKKGDLIEKLSNVIFSHWMVYIGYINGEHRIVHFSKNEKGYKLIVKEDTLEHGAEGKYIRINNSCDDHNEPFDCNEIVRRAKNDVGRADYGFFANNCEHTAVWCRVGVFESKQAKIVDHIKNVPVHPLITGEAWAEEMKKHPKHRGNWIKNMTEIEKYLYFERLAEGYPDLM